MKTNSLRNVLLPIMLVTLLVTSLIVSISVTSVTVKASPDTIFSDYFDTAVNADNRYSNWNGGTNGTTENNLTWRMLTSTTGAPKQGAGRLGLLPSTASPDPFINTPSFATTGYVNIQISFVWTLELDATRWTRFNTYWSTDNTNWTLIPGAGYYPGPPGGDNDNTVQKIISNLSVSSDANVGNKPTLYIKWRSEGRGGGSGSSKKVSFDNVVITGDPMVCGVEVVIENELLEGPPSTYLNYTIDVHNSGNSVENIVLSYIPDGWPDIVIIPPVLINVAPCEHRQATLTVHVPDGAAPSTYKEIYVVAESQFCHVTDSDTAQAHVTEIPPVCGVEVIIENKLLEGPPSTYLNYTINVHNSGNVVDNIILNYIPDGWPDIVIIPPVLINVAPCETRQATLTVHVPDGALPSTYKEIIVIAESQFCHVTDNDSALAHVIEQPSCGVDVTIVEGLLEGYPSQTLVYTIDVHNSGNVVDNIILSAIPDGWPDIIIMPPVLIDVMPSEHRQATLTVHVPDGALPSTYKEIIVIAESMFCHVTDSDSAMAHVLETPVYSVDVSISPSLQQGWIGDNLAYDVVVTNTGNRPDNYQLTLADALGWPHGWDAPSQVLATPIYGSTDNTFKDVQDVYIRENTPTVNYGGRYNMYVGTENNTGVVDMQKENLYTKWNLSVLPAGAIIDNAYMWLVGRYGPSHNPGLIADNMWVEAWSVTDDTWNENVLTWNTGGPAMVSLLDNVHWIASLWSGQYVWYKWNVTSFVTSEFAGDSVASIGMKSNGIGDNGIFGGNNGWFYQKDNYLGTGQHFRAPWMQVSYHTLGPTENTVSLGPGENWTGTVWVVVNGPGCTTDNKTVTATSMINPMTTDSATAQAHSAVCAVEINIANNFQEGMPSTVLNYTINVHNSGDLADTIVLSAIPDGWPDITIVPLVLINVQPSEWRQATLTVHVPDGALPSTYKEITVIAESEKCHATDNDVAIAHVLPLPCALEVTIDNDLLEGWPSQVLAYTISVHNSGSTVDNIILSVIPDGWPDITIIPQVLIDVMPSEVRQATMLIHVPDGAQPSTYKEIIVVAESQICHVTDSDSAQAHVVETPPLWTGTVTITLENMYAVWENIEGDAGGMGDKMVTKFYTYGGVYQDETVVTEDIPGHVTLYTEISRPGNGAIQRLNLVIVDSGNNELGTIATFVTSKTVMVARIGKISALWPFANDALKTLYVTELGTIGALWPFAPTE